MPQVMVAERWKQEDNGPIHGDHSGCFKAPVDTKTNVGFLYMLLILKWNFCFGVNRRVETT